MTTPTPEITAEDWERAVKIIRRRIARQRHSGFVSMTGRVAINELCREARNLAAARREKEQEDG